MPTERLIDGDPRTSLPRWLTEEEQRAWRAYIRLAQLLMRQLDRDLHPFGLSMHDYEILVELSARPDADDRACRQDRPVPQQALAPDQPDGNQGPGHAGGLRGRQARHVRGPHGPWPSHDRERGTVPRGQRPRAFHRSAEARGAHGPDRSLRARP